MTQTDQPSGRLEAIWIKRFRLGPMDPKESALAVTDRGLEDNANQGGKRQVTLLDADRWEETCRELGADLDPSLRRANLYVRGLELQGSRGRIVRLGGCRIRLLGETRPCNRMDEAHPGLRLALDPDWRAGAYGQILEGGEIRVGDAATWEDEA